MLKNSESCQFKLPRGKLQLIRSKFHIFNMKIGHERGLREPNRADNLHGKSCGPGTSFGAERGARKPTGRPKIRFVIEVDPLK